MTRPIITLIANGALGNLADGMFTDRALFYNEPTPIWAFSKKRKIFYLNIIRITKVFYNQQIAVLIGTRLSQHILVIGNRLAKHFAQSFTQWLQVFIEILGIDG